MPDPNSTQPDHTLTLVEALEVVSAVIPVLKSRGIIVDHQFVAGSVQEWSEVATDIEGELAKVLVIPAQVTQVMALLPVILQLVGVH